MQLRILSQLTVLATVFFLSSNYSHAQLDARDIPLYLRIFDGLENGLPAVHRAKRPTVFQKFIPERIPDYAWKLPKGPAMIQSAPGITIVNATPNASIDQTEVWVAVNPKNPLQIIAGSNDSRFNALFGVNRSMGSYYTTNGGKNWLESSPRAQTDLVNTSQGGTIFDPGLAFDTKGNCFYSYGKVQVLSGNLDGDNGIFISKSTDGGKSWANGVPAVANLTGDDTQPFEDRYLMCADISETSPRKDNLYISWTRFKNSGGPNGIHFIRSVDGGDNWVGLRSIPGGSNQSQGSMPATGLNGEVYVAWAKNNGSTTIAAFQKSTDGGATWLPTNLAAQTVQNPGTFNSSSGRNELSAKQGMRISAYPYMAVDLSNGPRRGWIYIAQAGKNSAGTQAGIFLTYSSDGGKTFKPGKKVDVSSSGLLDCFHPAVAVDPVTGTVGVFYYTSYHDPNNKGVDPYLATSTDGVNFSNVRLYDQTWFINSPDDVSNQGVGNIYWGDYTSMTAAGGKLFPCFWMPSSPQGNLFSVDTYVGIVNLGPLPVFNHKADASALTSCKLTWAETGLDGVGNLVTDFTIIVKKDGALLSEVAKGVRTFTDNSTLDGQTIEYQLIVKSSAGLESDPVTLKVTVGGALEPKVPTNVSAKLSENGVLLSWTNPLLHVDDSPFNDFDRIEVYSDSVMVATFPKSPTVQSGSQMQELISLPTKKFYKLTLKAVGKRGTIESKSVSSTQVVAYAGAPYSTFDGGFEGALDDLPRFSSGSWDVVTATNPTGKTKALTDSPITKYFNNSNNSVILAPMVVPSTENVSLAFRQIVAVLLGDKAVLYYSRDNGATWVFKKEWDRTKNVDWSNDISTSKWVEEEINFNDLKSDTVMFQLTLIAGALQNADGWYVDDVRFSGNAGAVEEPISKLTMFELYPNPASNELLIDLDMPTEGIAEIEVLDVIGKSVLTSNLGHRPSGSGTLRIDVSHIQSGIYNLRYRCGRYEGISTFSITR